MGKIARSEMQEHLERLAREANLKIASDSRDSGLGLDYLAPNGWVVVEERSGSHPFINNRLRGPEMVQCLTFATEVIRHIRSENVLPIPIKPASMFDARVIAIVGRIAKEHPHCVLTIDDLRILKAWSGK